LSQTFNPYQNKLKFDQQADRQTASSELDPNSLLLMFA